MAGGSDIALCCDVIVMEEKAKIGYPPARSLAHLVFIYNKILFRLWGCPTTFMWAHRVGLTWAKRLLLTGDLIDGHLAAKINLVTVAVRAECLDKETDRLVQRMLSVPSNQLAMQKLVINQIFENQGLVREGINPHSAR